MIRKTLTAGLALAALSLSACGERDGGMASNPNICAEFKVPTTAQATGSAPAAANASDAASPVDECVRRWAYSLAASRDAADLVAEAAVSACAPVLSRWNQAGLDQQAQTNENGQQQPALSLTTGQPTNPLAEHNAFAHGRALLYVMQARAGHCAPPPATHGTPAGT